MVDIPVEDLPDALLKGKVDAIAAFEPYPAKALKILSNKAVKLPKSYLY